MLAILDMVKEVMGPLCREFGLQIVAMNESDVILLARNYAIYIYTEPYEECPFMQYIDIPARGAMRRYSLPAFMWSKRRGPVTFPKKETSPLPLAEYARQYLQNMTDLLLGQGGDILRGEKEWLKEYTSGSGVHPVFPKVGEAIRKELESWDNASSS